MRFQWPSNSSHWIAGYISRKMIESRRTRAWFNLSGLANQNLTKQTKECMHGDTRLGWLISGQLRWDRVYWRSTSLSLFMESS